MSVQIKPYAILQKIRLSGREVYTDLKYLNDLENAKKAAFFDFMSASTVITDSEDPNEDASGAEVEVYVGRAEFTLGDVHKLVFDDSGEARWVPAVAGF
ncbi:MAG: hypothetical protein FWB85_00840 [Chitinispirillia bacterium]|nr:hypothetical protein [Chitinispirillia bacterium]MCL2241048.1 hypothetical protein [Chitinispirillia bacterium]